MSEKSASAVKVGGPEPTRKPPCGPDDHDFVEMSAPAYHKNDGLRNWLGRLLFGPLDRRVAYKMLFCRRCGGGKEAVALAR